MRYLSFINNFKGLALLLALALSLGCSSQGLNGPEFQGSEEFPGGLEGPSDDGSSGSESPEPPPTTLDGLISAIEGSLPGADSEAFQAPSAERKSQFVTLLGQMLNEITAGHGETLSTLGYESLSLNVGTDDKRVLALRETGNGSGAGTYIIDNSSASDWVIEIPHPSANSFAPLKQGAALFIALSARALFIAGTHPCANAATNDCTSDGSFCGETPRVSDVAHGTDSLFHEAHKSIDDYDSRLKFVSLVPHDSDTPSHQVILSNGSTASVGSFAFVNQVAAELADRVADGTTVGSCNLSADAVSGHCGQGHTQGRYSNGSDEACHTTPSSYTGRFLYLEQELSLADDASGDPLISAFTELF